MIKDLIFATTNSQKFQDVKRYIDKLNPSIILHQTDLEILEPQSLDIKEIAIFKAKYAWEQIKKPLIIDDGGIFIEKYNQFPGALSKWVFKGIGLDGIWLLAQENPKAYFQSTIAYIDGPDNVKLFSGIITGKIVKPKQSVQNLIMPYTEIFMPDGTDKVYAELKHTIDENKYNHRYKATEELVKWFNSHN